ncbi:protein phosphatase 1 regulatory subunit 36-like [Physella acuta]|uniref:protein phosphatase 1 regulatory subunit 36-like n=1 Tax=Physella acuta TaxID=109671 RepID=UPI0027DB419E|nr:protein phosphatase 1 regulatory subunit 36-like [Physella acuta]
MAKVASAFDGLPLSGKWVWKDDPEHPSLEFVSNNPNADKHEKKRRAKGHDAKGRSDRAASGLQRVRGAASVLNTQSFKRTGKKDPTQHSHVTLKDIKSVSLERMSEVDSIPHQFTDLISQDQFDFFLLYLLSYFNCYFHKMTLENKKNPMYIEPSISEKLEYANACDRLTVAQKLLGRAYCVLVLGLGLQEQHHMECGRSRVSKTYTDRSLFETFYTYCTFVVWINFRRKEFDAVKKEIGRILRSNTFNPAIRIKYSPEEPKETDPSKTVKKVDEEGEKQKPEEPKPTPAEYRRLHPKRPAIKSIVNQRSPAIVSIIPSPKEEAAWLFKKPQLQKDNPGMKKDNDEFENFDEKYSDLILDINTFKTGILGEPYHLFNAQTLSPLGAENEENEVEDADKGSSEGRETELKSQVSERGISRQQTAISHATTEAFTDDES